MNARKYFKYKYLKDIEYLGIEDDQPLKGLIGILGLNHNVLLYNRKLKQSELDKFELELIEIIGEKKDKRMADDYLEELFWKVGKKIGQ